MTRIDYLNTLKYELRSLPWNEQKEALDFYNNYFDDAGLDNIEAVLKELGSPQELAQFILQNINSVPSVIDGTTTKKYKTLQLNTKPKNHTWLIIILAILAAPIWFPIGITVIAIVFSLVVTGFALVFALVVTVFAILGAGIVLGGISLIYLFRIFTYEAVYGLGVGLILTGIGLIVSYYGIIFVIFIIKKLIEKTKKGEHNEKNE